MVGIGTPKGHDFFASWMILSYQFLSISIIIERMCAVAAGVGSIVSDDHIDIAT